MAFVYGSSIFAQKKGKARMAKILTHAYGKERCTSRADKATCVKRCRASVSSQPSCKPTG